MHISILKAVVGVFEKNGFHLHATHMTEEIKRGAVSEDKAKAIIEGIRSILGSDTTAKSETPTPEGVAPASA